MSRTSELSRLGPRSTFWNADSHRELRCAGNGYGSALQSSSSRWLLSVAHCIVDIYSSALGALQPLLAIHFGLSLTQAGLLGGALVSSSYLTQPAFGVLADRLPSRMYAILGPLIAGICISGLGLAPNFGILLAMVCLGGVGMAMFHPQASSSVLFGAGQNRGRVMGIFIGAGAVGFSIGPTALSALAELVGLRGLWIAAIPGLVISALLFLRFAPIARPPSRAASAQIPARVKKALLLLFLLVCIRSVIQVTYGHLLPLYFTRELGYSTMEANSVLSLYFAAGAAGGMIGGRLADSFGGQRVIEWSMILSVPLLLTSFLTAGALSIVTLVMGGFVLLLTIPVNVMMAQELAPDHTSTVSAFMMGFAWGITGILFVPLTAWAAERTSLHHALMALSAFPLIGFLLARRYPERSALS